MPPFTLQVNLSPGDLGYAELTVPRLVAAHPGAAERLLVVDCCRPQATRIVDPERRFARPAFDDRVAAVRGLAGRWRRSGLFDRLEFIEPGDPRLGALARRFVRPWMTETHDYGGCAFMAYWAALAAARCPLLVHYDADIVLRHPAASDWVVEAAAAMAAAPGVIAAAPRTSPPGWAPAPAADAPSRHEGRPLARTPAGWLHDWFSSRCFVLDCGRLGPHLPLIGAVEGLGWRFRRLAGRGYPPSPELVLHHGLSRRGLRCLILSNPETWLLHPGVKPPDLAALLPRLFAANDAGMLPPSQRGCADIDFPAWRHLLGAPS